MKIEVIHQMSTAYLVLYCTANIKGATAHKTHCSDCVLGLSYGLDQQGKERANRTSSFPYHICFSADSESSLSISHIGQYG